MFFGSTGGQAKEKGPTTVKKVEKPEQKQDDPPKEQKEAKKETAPKAAAPAKKKRGKGEDKKPMVLATKAIMEALRRLALGTMEEQQMVRTGVVHVVGCGCVWMCGSMCSNDLGTHRKNLFYFFCFLFLF